mgnify:CR=1 FL=1
MKIEIPEEVFGVKKWQATVVSNYNVATYIKEFIVEVPEDMPYEAGGYIQIEIPNCEVPFTEMDITAHPEDHPGEPNKFDKDWAEGPFAMRGLVMKNDEGIFKMLSKSSIIGNHYENVTHPIRPKNSKNPRCLTLRGFFFCFHYSMSLASLFLIKFKETLY